MFLPGEAYWSQSLEIIALQADIKVRVNVILNLTGCLFMKFAMMCGF